MEDSVDGTRKDHVLDRLNKRNKDRQNYLDVKLEQRSKDCIENEGVDYFAQTFGQRAYDIEQSIKSVQLTSGGDAPPALNQLTKHFADITMQIQELQNYLTASTMFLSDFKIKSCQNMLNSLTSSSDEARQRLIPKKKFGFSGKKTSVNVKQKPQLIDKPDAMEKLETTEKKVKQFDWTIANSQNRHLILSGDDVNGQDITISNLSHCLIELQGHPGSVQISKATHCTILCGPISRSFFAEQLTNCTLAIACQQLRLHSSQSVCIYLHVTCRAIIEDSSGIDIAEYNYDYPELENDYIKSGLNKSQNNYTDVADFNWLSPDIPSPNWTLLKDYAAPNWTAQRREFLSKHNVNDNIANNDNNTTVKDISII
ncbi:tubulin-specific chaperone C [Drosophila tropicalis]|uniref:tubulin-specific chaperone C n=1 Tax=Drosophila tropicalis TaxID=46794 RepID=UPI0035AB7D63